MGHGHVRVDKTCLNCNHVVEHRFCPNCGQENIDTRKTFHHLFVHFFEDLTHYENSFWKTIRNLILKPASLTKEYLSGKRMSYLAPVRLYIFISFATFLTLSLAPDIELENGPVQLKGENNQDIKASLDTLNFKNMNMYKDLKALDSSQAYTPEEEKMPEFIHETLKKSLHVLENNSPNELEEKFKESFIHNFPKVLFIYMPIFAFFLWLFHSKKKWYYFDHGIFTLHYFSFLLITYLILTLVDLLLYAFGENIIVNVLSGIMHFIGFVWAFYYFFPAHHRFYGCSRRKSVLKGTILFFINAFFISLLLTFFAVYTFINIH
ncbi:DUF3667 domain-containing protein [Flavobacterium soli]|uniref:DUF3667 domain-containing protein n=1 Tax=Flavobacterium soli TaxID=344881 RepID=UPI00040CAF29|nr:DUF3667 domain-containing protein [Flavobacterium soli]